MVKKFFICIFLLGLFFQGYTQEKEVKAVIETNFGNMVVKLYNDTPKHRDNFIRLARAGHYDGTLFYRVIQDFVIQGGSSDSRGAMAGRAIGLMQKLNRNITIKREHWLRHGNRTGRTFLKSRTFLSFISFRGENTLRLNWKI